MSVTPSPGYIGAGQTGAPMAARLNAAGTLATVWHRTPDKASGDGLR